MALARNEIQVVLSTIWTRVVDPISSNRNYFIVLYQEILCGSALKVMPTFHSINLDKSSFSFYLLFVDLKSYSSFVLFLYWFCFVLSYSFRVFLWGKVFCFLFLLGFWWVSFDGGWFFADFFFSYKQARLTVRLMQRRRKRVETSFRLKHLSVDINVAVRADAMLIRAYRTIDLRHTKLCSL